VFHTKYTKFIARSRPIRFLKPYRSRRQSKEVLHRADLEAIIGKRPFVDPTPGESSHVPEVGPMPDNDD